MYFFLLLLFVFISPPLPLSSPRHRTCTYTPPALPQTPPALPLWLLPHCMHGGQWGGGCILIAGGLTSPPPPPLHPGKGRQELHAPGGDLPIGFLHPPPPRFYWVFFSGGGVCFNYSPSAIADKNTSSLLCVPPGRWAAVGCVGCGFIHYLLCWLLFLGGWERCMGFPPPPPLQTSRCSQVVSGASFTCCSSSPRMLGGCSHSEARWARGRLWLCSHTATSLRSCWVTALKSKVLSWGSRAST